MIATMTKLKDCAKGQKRFGIQLHMNIKRHSSTYVQFLEVAQVFKIMDTG